MATPLVIANDFTDGQPSVAADVDTNFNDIATYINASVIATDSFSAIPSVPFAPTASNHVARKVYVDDTVAASTGMQSGFVEPSSQVGTASYVTVTGSTTTITDPGKAIVLMIHSVGRWNSGISGADNYCTLEVDWGTGTFGTVQTSITSTDTNLGNVWSTMSHAYRRAGTPGGDIRIRLQIKSAVHGLGTVGTLADSAYTWQMFKTVTI